MKPDPALKNLTAALVDICRAGLQPDRLREEVFARLGRAVPFDAAFWATLDPATLLFTRGHQQDIPPEPEKLELTLARIAGVTLVKSSFARRFTQSAYASSARR